MEYADDMIALIPISILAVMIFIGLTNTYVGFANSIVSIDKNRLALDLAEQKLQGQTVISSGSLSSSFFQVTSAQFNITCAANDLENNQWYPPGFDPKLMIGEKEKSTTVSIPFMIQTWNETHAAKLYVKVRNL